MTPTIQSQELHWDYPATLKNVERVCNNVSSLLDTMPLQQKDRFAIHLLLRESLNNAVLHGCHQNPLLTFSCSLVISEEKISISIKDDGPGFDWHNMPLTPPDKSRESGRGRSIYTIYATSIEYNDAGNCITLTRTFNQGE